MSPSAFNVSVASLNMQGVYSLDGNVGELYDVVQDIFILFLDLMDALPCVYIYDWYSHFCIGIHS